MLNITRKKVMKVKVTKVKDTKVKDTKVKGTKVKDTKVKVTKEMNDKGIIIGQKLFFICFVFCEWYTTQKYC